MATNEDEFTMWSLADLHRSKEEIEAAMRKANEDMVNAALKATRCLNRSSAIDAEIAARHYALSGKPRRRKGDCKDED